MLTLRALLRAAAALLAALSFSWSPACSRTGLRTLPIPRAIAPLSTSMVTSRRPRFRWVLDGEEAPTQVEVCADRACATVLAEIDASGTSAVPPADLPPGVVYWRVRVSFGDELGTLSTPVWEVTIPTQRAPVDTSWGTVLDVDGDGLADVAVGAPMEASATGRVYLYRGGLAGLAHPPFVLTGPDGAAGQFGSSVASAGDVDGDGFADLVVGAWCAPATGGPSGCGPGRAYVYRGGPHGPASAPSAILSSPDASDSVLGGFAQQIAGAGDVNGDGYGDLVVLGTQCQRSPDRCVIVHAYVYLGGPGGLTTTPATELVGPDDSLSGGFYDQSLAAGADVNGDGYADVLLAGYGPPPGGSGHALSQLYEYLGGPSGLPATPAATLDGGGEILGVRMATLGDVNGDGYPDFAVWLGDCPVPSAQCAPERMSIHAGGPAGLAFAPSATLVSPDGAGYAMVPSGPGDVDGDGYADLLLFDNRLDGGGVSGHAFLVRGGPSGLAGSPAVPVIGPGGVAAFTGGALGVLSGVTGDVDGDGLADVLVASPLASSVLLYRGSPGGLDLPAAVLASPGSSDGDFGLALARRATPVRRQIWNGSHVKARARAFRGSGIVRP